MDILYHTLQKLRLSEKRKDKYENLRGSTHDAHCVGMRELQVSAHR